MIVLTIAELLAARGAGQELAEMDVPMQVAFDLRDLLREIDTRLKSYEDQRRALFERFGQERDTTEAERRASGDLRVREIPTGHQVAFAQQLNELLAVTVEFDRTAVQLPISNGLRIKPRVLLALGPLVQRDGG